MREIINLQVGQCGNNVGLKFVQKILEEHGIDNDGTYTGTNDYQRQRIDVFFAEVDTNNYRSRSVLVDLDPGTIDNALGSPFAHLFDPDNLVAGSGSGSNNWAVGYYTRGAELIHLTMDAVRREVEACDSLEGFQVLQSMGGGTGSGLGSLCISTLKDIYGDCLIQTFPIFPSPKVSDAVTEPYNSVLSIHNQVEHVSLCNTLDNEALFDICQKKLKIEKPNYGHLNELVATLISGVTCGLRFPGQINSSLRKQAVNLVTFPRVHFFMNSLSPYVNDPKSTNSVQQIVSNLFSPSSFMVSADPRQGRYATASITFRGEVSSREAELSCRSTIDKNSSYFYEWIPNNIQCSLCSTPSPGKPLSAVFTGNSTAIQ